MLIQCTKKLLDEAKLHPISPEEEYDPLFSWHANLLEINKKKTVELVNDRNRYMIVLYGLRAKDFKNLDHIVVDAVRENLCLESVKPDVIDRYLPHDMPVQYAKTRSQTAVGRMNVSCEYLYFSGEELDPNRLNQAALGMEISRKIVGMGKRAYIVPNEEMFSNLEEWAGTPVFEREAVQVKVTMELEAFDVWRRLLIPADFTFRQVHDVLQRAFNWRDSHPHDFEIYGEGMETIGKLVCDSESLDLPANVPLKLETECRLCDVLPGCKKIIYTYDFGDCWIHRLEVEKIIPSYRSFHAVCLAGSGDAPPEDAGGEDGYEDFLKVISDPAHEDYDSIVAWGEQQGYEKFDIEDVNWELKSLCRR